MTKEDNCIFNVFSGIEDTVNRLESDALKILERLDVFEKSDSPAAVFDGELWEALHDMLVRTSILAEYINNPDEKHTVKKGEFDPTKLPNALLVKKAYSIVQKIPDLMPFGRIYNMDAFNENCDKLRLLVNDLCVEKLPGDGDMSIKERAARALDELRNVKLILSYKYTQIVRLTKSDVDKIKVSEQDIFAEIDRTFRKFSTKFSDECYGQLNQKPRVPGSWEKVCEDEREMYSLILEDESKFIKDKRFKLYDKKLKEGILHNRPLIETVSKINIDGKLWFGDKWTDHSVDMTEVYEALDTDNFLIFCILALRHNLIQCEVYPELKLKFEAWLKGKVCSNNEPEKSNKPKMHRTAFELSDANKRDLGDILSLLKKGVWSDPAKEESVTELIEVLYGARQDELDEDDWDNARMFREFFRRGKCSRNFTRLEISTANIVGYFMEYGYLPNSPKMASNQIFGKGSCTNNINKGKRDNRCDTFGKLIPFIDKYRLRLIEKHD